MTYSLVTGATGVLGKCFCYELAERGENLFLTGRSGDKLQELKDKLTAQYPSINVKFYPANLQNDGEREALFEYAGDLKFSRLINCAGADIQKKFEDYDQEKLTFQIRANFEGAAAFTLFALKHRAESLKITNISSVCGAQPMPYFAIYSALKGALTSFSVALSREVRGKGVEITAIVAGSIYTREDVKKYIDSLGFWARRAAKSPQYIVKKSLKYTDRGRKKVVVGGLNKLAQFLLKFVPQGVKGRYIAKKWSKSVKDAF